MYHAASLGGTRYLMLRVRVLAAALAVLSLLAMLAIVARVPERNRVPRLVKPARVLFLFHSLRERAQFVEAVLTQKRFEAVGHGMLVFAH